MIRSNIEFNVDGWMIYDDGDTLFLQSIATTMGPHTGGIYYTLIIHFIYWLNFVLLYSNSRKRERKEKRQRIQFKNEQYKKPRKKTKSRNSTVYSTMRQQSLCGFISLNNDLY